MASPPNPHLADEAASGRAGPALRRASPAEMRERVPQLPPGPHEFDVLLAQLERDVLPFMRRCDHPGVFAFIPACGTFPAAPPFL